MEKYKIVLTPYAVYDLKEISDYLYLQTFDENKVELVTNKIKEKIMMLSNSPLLGKELVLSKKIKTKYRTIVSKPYIIFYYVDMKQIIVVRIINSKRDYMLALKNRL